MVRQLEAAVQSGELQDSCRLRLVQVHLGTSRGWKQLKEEQQLLKVEVDHLLRCHRKYRLLHLLVRKLRLSEVRASCCLLEQQQACRCSLDQLQRQVQLY